MSILIRKIRCSGSTIIESVDVEFEDNRLLVGSSSECDLQLFGDGIAAKHMRLHCDNDAMRFECLSKARVDFDGRVKRRGRVRLGQSISIGGNCLTVIDAPPGFELAFELVVDVEQEASSRGRLASDFAATIPPTRWVSYLLATLIIVAGLILPIYAYLQEPTETEWQKADAAWDSGPLIRAHQTQDIGDNCGVCHTDAFTPVQEQTCLGCHNEISQHHPGHPGLDPVVADCMSCHSEHSEPASMMTGGDWLCVKCHQRPIDMHESDRQLVEVTGFNKTAHPKFGLSPLQYHAEQHRWLPSYQPASSGTKEDSNLQFPHELHLNADKVSRDGDEGLICADCHTQRDDGEHFNPIDMETHCSSCHSLGLDVRYPERRVPHASPQIVKRYLEEYHIAHYARFSEDVSDDLNVAPPRAGEVKGGDECDLEDDIAQCGIDLAKREMERLFRKSGCVECHDVTQETDGKQTSWTVQPVKLTQDWHANAVFSHEPHLQLGLGDGDESCLSCHEADVSKHSSDVLMPGLDNCLQCHSDDTDNQVLLQCQECHDFHRKSLPAMKSKAGGDRMFWQDLRRKLGMGP